MFRKRLRWFTVLLIALAGVLVGRLLDIQVLRADTYEELALRLIAPSVEYLSAPRGRILDRNGRVLVSHEPSFDVSVHYAVLTGQSYNYLRRTAWLQRRLGDLPADADLTEVTQGWRIAIADMWQRLADLTGKPVSSFIERGEDVRRRVELIRADVQRRTGIKQPVANEFWYYPVVEDVSDDLALQVRLELAQLPWLQVTPSSRRIAHDADAAVHLLGRLGAVSAERLRDDPLADEELRRLHPNDRCGITGVERLAETTLRGTRGKTVRDFDGTLLERIEPVPGGDVTLTVDMALQEFALATLAEAIDGTDEEGHPKMTWPAGGAAVVIDVASREVLALASYPVYAYDRFSADYGDLVRDARRTPTRFRAVNGLYPPGSTCKAITLVGALAEHETTPHERIHCTGHLLPNRPHMFRCWIYNDFGTTHDASRNSAGLNGAEAIQNSCNIYFFRTGARLGCERLCHWFKRFGLGRTQGTGLIEESAGILPTRERLGRPYQPSDAWNFAIGQGEVTATPLQVANVCATIAAGHWAPVSILRAASDEAATRLHGEPDFDPAALRELRKGMWRVVNERLGTAYSRRLKRDDYVLCGKTGTAQAVPQPTEYRYTFEWPDGRREVVHAYLESDARRTAIAKWGGDPERVGKHTSRRYPDLLRGELSSHGWFMGYTQRADVPPGAAPRGRVYAIAVVIEYGLSGSRAAGPVATTLAEYVLEHAE